ncbi:hypothetical protein G7K_2503-t1 [Saitoella complicata NRRL Y-17804]|uniref:Probable quinone oxidoreductase n=2 Tax=Saitoella complicata (strain BCRC 22490 / CBS 7301 / JCM 7358 / NBRC 10748 / NRRL Y-17804) TaxID=698492 RepID=A0A0E9NEQ3_SAICN|nr:hypothetical protein G7K_2503-t1 [Saitoella complicata NRRL Y-17804]
MLRARQTSNRLTQITTQMRTMSSSSLPSKMRIIQIEKTGGRDVLQYDEVPVPKPGSGQVLIKNEFIGVNYIDTYFRTGLYPPPKFPYILGREGSGQVVAIGEGVKKFSEGDRVVYLAEASYAEYTLAAESKTSQIPEGISNHDAAAVLLQGLTALTLIREAHEVKKGDWVLVHAAAGGVGLNLCQLLRGVGAHVIGTVSTPEKAELAKKHGAEHIIMYTEEDVEKKVNDLTGGLGCHAVFDGVGKSTFDVSLNCTRRKGTLASYGNASGAVPPLTIARLSAKNVKVCRPTLFNYITTEEEWTQHTRDLFDFVLKGDLEIKVHEVYKLAESARAHEDLEGRKTTGKLLMKP